MLTSSLTLVFSVAFVVSVLVTLVARNLAVRGGLLDHPDDRKQHETPVPRVGGVGIAAGVFAGVAVAGIGSYAAGWPLFTNDLAPVLIGAAIVFGLGLWDDLHGLGFKRRLAVQASVAWGLTLLGWHVDLTAVPLFGMLGPETQTALSVPVTILWTVGLINAMNLLDGLDGLAAGTAVIGFVCLAVAFGVSTDLGITLLCVVGAAATLGFFVFNRNPATVFMGDGGSTLLGFLLAMAGIRGVSSGPSGAVVLVPVLALGLPILDTLTQMTRRLLRGESPFAADRDHLHHRALDRSGSVTKAVRKLYAVAVGFGVLAWALSYYASRPGPQAVVLAVAVLLAVYVIGRLEYLRAPRFAKAVGPALRRPWSARMRYRRKAAYLRDSGDGLPGSPGLIHGDGASTRELPDVEPSQGQEPGSR